MSKNKIEDKSNSVAIKCPSCGFIDFVRCGYCDEGLDISNLVVLHSEEKPKDSDGGGERVTED